jgi:hypothetical protein
VRQRTGQSFPRLSPRIKEFETSSHGGEANILKTTLFIAALFLAGCAVNVHQNGRCATPGVSPFASNCPTAEELKSH